MKPVGCEEEVEGSDGAVLVQPSPLVPKSSTTGSRLIGYVSVSTEEQGTNP